MEVLKLKYKISFLISRHIKEVDSLNKYGIINESNINTLTLAEIRNCSLIRLNEILLFFKNGSSKDEIIKFQKCIIQRKKVRFVK